MPAPETLTPRTVKRNHREYATADGDLVIAYQQAPGAWLVTAHSADLGAQVQGMVEFNDAGFRGRQWESAIDGQQHASLIAAMREAVAMARRQADVAAFARADQRLRAPHGLTYNPERRYGCTVCPWTGNDPDAAQAHVDYLTTHPRGWMGLAEEHPVIDRQASFTYTRERLAETLTRVTKDGSYSCPCGWNRIILDSETPEDARLAHEGADIHSLALKGLA